MARRLLSTASDDSQKENSGINRKVKAEKMQQRKETRKETARATRQRVETEDEHEEEQEEEQNEEDSQGEEEDGEGENEDEDENEEGASPKGRKRVRVNTEGDSRAVNGTLRGAKREKERMQTLPRDVDGFIPGAIVRVQLKNFVTYDYVEFCPGPYLNMIFGPNGTGKSTIACAICLGLNFPPSVLGRASELPSFVKIGTDSGHIEIELKGTKGKPNLIIRRTLSAKSKSSTFTLNGHAATGKEINARMAGLNVQVSNLCTFLPQDKVSEFAQMSPQQLLRETQRAAGNANLTNWHNTLISSGKELKQFQELLNADHDQLKTMEERNANLERDVRRYEERRQIERAIDLLELILPFKKYMEAKEEYFDAKATQRKLHDKVKVLKEKNAPILEVKKTFERQLKELDESRESKKVATKRRFEHMKKRWADNDRMENEAEDVKNQLDNLKTAERNRLKEIQRCDKEILRLKNLIDDPPEMEDLQEINNQIKHLNLDHVKTRDRQTELQERQRVNVQEESKQRAVVEQHQQSLRQLDDASHRKLQELARWDRDCADAVKWLRDNNGRFKMEVFEPPMLCLTVPNRRYADAVEACFGGNQMKTFVAQCEEDYQLLNRLLVDTPEALGRKVRLNTWFRVENENSIAPPPMTEEELQSLGFDGYALQYVSCPEGLKWFLKNINLHRTAICLQSNRVDPNRAMEMVSRIGPRGEGGGASYVTGNVFNTVSRSRYGKRLPQNSTREVRPARNLVYSDIDPTVKRTHDTAIAEARQKLDLCAEEAKLLARDEAQINADHKAYKNNYEALNSRKQKVVDQQSRLTRAKVKIEQEQARLDSLRAAPSMDTERTNLKARLLALAKKRADIAKDYLKHIRATIKEQEEATRIGLQWLQVGANKAALEVMCRQQDEEYQQALAEFNEAHRRYEIAKADSKSKLQISKDKLDSVDDEIRDQFKEMEESGEANKKTAEEIQAELDAKREQLEMNMHTNAGVVEQYNKRKAEIGILTATMEEREKKVGKVERAIKAARDNWQPALEELVSSIGKRFSAAFDRLGCAGEIRISEHEDYDKWAIDILVKFRDDEKLQLLTGERQSGGERSLTTILYLMSLTEEARAPFSLVDEINQGMDQRAERAVHNSLVEVTCKADSGQYFLITPKLLPDLKYDERMKVLCVNNGEWLPEESGIGNMMSLIEGYVHHNRTKASV
ncbi:hypothetical protein AcW1_005022 [Taiwanofungus camphoratus]|nr:hypothetical protein AcW2_005969 [Antrodia cinnamomea]KAI0960531.1 hypothetical protein AcW1_005022 [Antrodia cinnamomea]